LSQSSSALSSTTSHVKKLQITHQSWPTFYLRVFFFEFCDQEIVVVLLVRGYLHTITAEARLVELESLILKRPACVPGLNGDASAGSR
jgi:hypothetical protein